MSKHSFADRFRQAQSDRQREKSKVDAIVDAKMGVQLRQYQNTLSAIEDNINYLIAEFPEVAELLQGEQPLYRLFGRSTVKNQRWADASIDIYSTYQESGSVKLYSKVFDPIFINKTRTYSWPETDTVGLKESRLNELELWPDTLIDTELSDQVFEALIDCMRLISEIHASNELAEVIHKVLEDGEPIGMWGSKHSPRASSPPDK